MLKMSPANQMITNCSDNASAELFLKFSMICGEKTTIQHAIDIALRTHWLAVETELRVRDVPENAADSSDV
jgi:hypothetical protein